MANFKFQKKLGARIQKARESADISQIELAELLKLNPATVNNYEKGHRQPSIETLIKISDITKCSISYLVQGAEYDDDSPSPEDYYITKSCAVQLLTCVSREYRSDEFKTNVKDIIHCIYKDDWGKPKGVVG